MNHSKMIQRKSFRNNSKENSNCKNTHVYMKVCCMVNLVSCHMRTKMRRTVNIFFFFTRDFNKMWFRDMMIWILNIIIGKEDHIKFIIQWLCVNKDGYLMKVIRFTVQRRKKQIFHYKFHENRGNVSCSIFEHWLNWLQYFEKQTR